MQNSDLAEDVIIPSHITLQTISKGIVGHTDDGLEIHRFIGSAEIVDVQGEKIDISAIAEIMPIMEKQGRRINGFHATQPAGHFTDWGLAKLNDTISAVWLDVAVYDVYPSQKENLRRLHLPEEDPEKIRGLSIGGKRLEKHRECDSEKCYLRTTKLEGWEWSLVDKPANPLALLTEELSMAITKSIAKSDKATSQDRDRSGQFSKNHTGECECAKHKDDKITKTKVRCVDCGEIHEHVKKMEEDDEEEYLEEDEMKADDGDMEAEGEEVSDEEVSEEGMEMEGEEYPEGEEEVEGGEFAEEEVMDADVEKPDMAEGYPESGMPEGENNMNEEIGYIKMQIDKLMTALNIEKAETTPQEYVDDKGNVYKLQKGVVKEKTPEEIIKGLEEKVAELSAQSTQSVISNGQSNLQKHDAGLPAQPASGTIADIQKMNISDRLKMMKNRASMELQGERISVVN